MLEKNRIALKEKGILEIVENCEEDYKVKWENGKLFYGNVELDEDKNIDIEPTAIDTIFVFGFGRGNLIKKIRKKSKESVVVVFEKNPCIIKEVLKYQDLSDIISDHKLIISIVKEDPNKTIKTIVQILHHRLNWSEIFNITTPNYEKMDIEEILNKEILTIIVNRNTLISKSRELSKNSLKVVPDLSKGEYIESFNDKFKNKPAIVVSSGPSLSKNIKLLKEIRDRAVIIAIDSVLSVLDNEGIEPDFICGVDYSHVNEMKYTPILKRKKKSDIVYVATAEGIFYSIPKLFKQTFFEISNASNISSLYKDIFKKSSKKHFSINNVTNLAIEFAYIIGANPIIFVGQDWAYSGGADHASGVYVEAELPKNIMWVKGNYETKVPTDATLLSGQKLVEDIIEFTESDNIEYINATEGGAYIKGTKVLTLKEVEERYLKEKINKKFIKEFDIKIKHDEFIKRTKEIINELENIIKKSSKTLVLGNSVLKKWLRNKNVEEIREDVEKMNKVNDEITFNRVFNSTAATYFFKEFFNFYREEMYVEGQDTKQRIEQAIKYFKMIKEKSIQIKKLFDSLSDILKLENAFYKSKDRFVKNLDKVLRLASLYFEFRDIYGGLELIDKAMEIHKDSADLYYWKAKLCTLNRFMHLEALKNFEKAIQINPDFEKAIFDYKVEKNMVLSHFILMKNALEKHEFKNARMLLKRIKEYEPDNANIKEWEEIVNMFSTIDKKTKKQNILFGQLKIEDEVFKKYKKVVDLIRKQKINNAFELLKDLYEQYGAFGDIPFLLGSIYIDRKEFDKAEKYLKEAVELIPYQPLVYLALGKLYIEKEEYLLAKENLEKAVAMNPDLKPGVLDTLGNLYYEFGEYEKAFRAFDEYLQYSDDKIKTLTKLALCYKEMGMTKEYNELTDKIRTITIAN